MSSDGTVDFVCLRGTSVGSDAPLSLIHPILALGLRKVNRSAVGTLPTLNRRASGPCRALDEKAVVRMSSDGTVDFVSLRGTSVGSDRGEDAPLSLIYPILALGSTGRGLPKGHAIVLIDQHGPRASGESRSWGVFCAPPVVVKNERCGVLGAKTHTRHLFDYGHQ